MANRILKGIAIAAGTGLAMGFTSGRTRVSPRPRSADDHSDTEAVGAAVDPISGDSDEILNIEPLLDRLERLEERMEILMRPSPVFTANPEDYRAALTELERRIDENAHELALLRERIEEAERRAAESAVVAQKSAEEARADIPAIVEHHVAIRADDLRDRFSAEIEESHKRMLETFERAIDEKISSRIGSIERVLAVQAGSIDALTARAQETDNNLQRLVLAIEKLCERSQLIGTAPAAPQFSIPSFEETAQAEARAFDAHFRDAMRREPVVPIVRTAEPGHEARQVPAPAFTGTDSQVTKKSRFPFRSLIVAGFSLIASRFFR